MATRSATWKRRHDMLDKLTRRSGGPLRITTEVSEEGTIHTVERGIGTLRRCVIPWQPKRGEVTQKLGEIAQAGVVKRERAPTHDALLCSVCLAGGGHAVPR
jgi:hypothetical protein